jgi:hypothetical protein
VRRLWVVAVVGACSFEHGVVPTGMDSGGRSGSADAPPDMPMSQGGTAWSTPVEITELTGFSEDDPSLTADLLEIYFGSRRTGGAGMEDIWHAKRASVTAPWGTPENVTPLNTMDTETTGKITNDGLFIYFTRTGNDPDIYFSYRTTTGDPWAAATRVNELSTNDPDYGPAVRLDRLRTVLCRGRTVAEEAIWVTERTSIAQTWPAASVISELDEAGYSECDPMEPTDNVLYFATNHTADGKYDIVRTSRPNAQSPFTTPVPVAGINADGFEDRDPWVSADEKYMVFSSDRSGGVFKLFLSTR